MGDFDDDNIKALVDEYIQSFESDIRGTLKGELKAMSEGSGTDADIWRVISQARTTDHKCLTDSTANRVHAWLSDQTPRVSSNRHLNPYVLPLNDFKDRGVRYCVAQMSSGDSHIIFVRKGGQRWKAGRIVKMFRYYQYERDGFSRFTQVFFLVEEYCRLTEEDAKHDPYRKFPVAGGQLLYNTCRQEPRLLTVDDILCHCAIIPRRLPGANVECIHVLPLDKVSVINKITNFTADKCCHRYSGSPPSVGCCNVM